MANCKINSKYIKKIVERKEENGVIYYKVAWKEPEPWIEEEELSGCSDLLEAFNRPSRVALDCVDEARMAVLSLGTNLHDKVLKRPQCQNWYQNDEVKQKLKNFKDVQCKTPTDEIKKAKGKHTIMMQQMEQEFQNLKEIDCKKLEYTGSAYEGLKISSDRLEFDVMFVMDGKDLEPKIISEGYCNMSPKDPRDEKYYKYLDAGNLSPSKIRQKFFSLVQTFVNKYYPRKIKVLEHGPAVQIDVQKENGTDVWYSVDLVPSYEVKYQDKTLRYVPKPLIEPDDEEGNLCNSWRRSFSEEEKSFLKGLDKDNGCYRQVARIIKGIFRNESTYSALSSYHVKTVLFHIAGKMKDERMTWKDKDYVERVFDMLGIMEGYLAEGNLPHFYVPSMNLVKNIKPTTLSNIKNRISGLRSSQKKFLQAISIN